MVLIKPRKPIWLTNLILWHMSGIFITISLQKENMMNKVTIRCSVSETGAVSQRDEDWLKYGIN